MNWAKIKALNSTVGTSGFKPLDVLIGEKLDSLNGRMIPVQFEEKTLTFHPSSLNDLNLDFKPLSGKWYSIEYDVSARKPNDIGEVGSHVWERTEPFKIYGNNYVFAKYVPIPNAYDLPTGMISNIYIHFYMDKDGFLHATLLPNNSSFDYDNTIKSTLIVKKIYEVL